MTEEGSGGDFTMEESEGKNESLLLFFLKSFWPVTSSDTLGERRFLLLLALLEGERVDGDELPFEPLAPKLTSVLALLRVSALNTILTRISPETRGGGTFLKLLPLEADWGSPWRILFLPGPVKFLNEEMTLSWQTHLKKIVIK